MCLYDASVCLAVYKNTGGTLREWAWWRRTLTYKTLTHVPLDFWICHWNNALTAAPTTFLTWAQLLWCCRVFVLQPSGRLTVSLTPLYCTFQWDQNLPLTWLAQDKSLPTPMPSLAAHAAHPSRQKCSLFHWHHPFHLPPTQYHVELYGEEMEAKKVYQKRTYNSCM
jgi:hypothetical protein